MRRLYRLIDGKPRRSCITLYDHFGERKSSQLKDWQVLTACIPYRKPSWRRERCNAAIALPGW